MKYFIGLLLLASLCLGAHSQTVTQDITVETELSPIGVPLLYESSRGDKLQGRCMYRNENGCINRWGYYDSDENFWGIEFSFNKDLSKKFADLQLFQKGQLMETTITLQQQVIDSLFRLCRNYNEFADHPGFSKMRKDLKGDIDDYRNLIVMNLKIERGNYLIYYMVSLVENYISLKMLEPLIDYYFIQIAGKRYPGSSAATAYQLSPLDVEHSKLHNFRDSLESLYYESFVLADKLKTTIRNIEFSRAADSILLHDIGIINEKYYVLEFDNLYHRMLEPLVNQAKEFLRQNNPSDSVEMYSLIRKFDPFVTHYAELKTQDDSIRSLLKKLKYIGEVRQTTGSISYIAEVDAGIKPYFEATDFDEKRTTGRQAEVFLRDKLSELQSLTRIEVQIDAEIIGIKKRFLDKQPIIFKTEVLPLDLKIGEYKAETSVIVKLQSGKQIIDKITELNTYYDSLNMFDTVIDGNYKKLKSAFLGQYPQIFINDIKPLEAEINNYENEGVAAAKISKALQLLDGMQEYTDNLQYLIRQEHQIDTAKKQAMLIYKNRFPKVYRIEFGMISKEIEAYKNLAFLQRRIQMGKDIHHALQLMNGRYDSICALDQIIAQHYQKVRKDYSKNFPGIQKKQFSLIDPQYLLYEENGNSKEKLNCGSFVCKNILRLQQDYRVLDSIGQQIVSVQEQCRLVYNKNPENQVIWKKGKKLQAYYNKLFFNAEEKKTAEDYANDMLILLNKMISLSKKDNSFMKAALENAKTPEEIRKIFGI
jgi:hypothetical protein